ncbi:hypothetical protein KD793_14715 [Klebsiella pneumoniae]
MFAGKKSAQIREILISESAWEEMTCLFAPSLSIISLSNAFKNKWLIESTPMCNIFYQNNFHWPQR